MTDAERQTRSRLKALFEELGIHPRTDYGQNFLIDLNLIDVIVEQAELGPHDVVWEVGAGTGGLTARLAQSAAAVVAVEIDRRLFEVARNVLDSYDNVTLLRCDVLKNKNRFAPEVLEAVERELAVDPQRRLKLVANLPYNIATPVITNLVASDLPWERMVVTIQWELAERMTARPGTSAYGALSVWIQSQCDVEIVRKLRPTVFWPRPKVESAIVLLRPNPQGRARIANREFFRDFLRRLFHQRRKFLRRVVVGMYRKQLSKPEVDAVLEACGLGADNRAEELSVEKLIELANALYRRVGASAGCSREEGTAAERDAAERSPTG